MRTVVVGATGNAGTALLRALARDRPNDSVVGVARRPPETESPFPTMEWVSLDVTAADAADRLRAVMRDADAVVHLAIAFQPMRERSYLRAVNVDAVRTVATACAAPTSARAPTSNHVRAMPAFASVRPTNTVF